MSDELRSENDYVSASAVSNQNASALKAAAPWIGLAITLLGHGVVTFASYVKLGADVSRHNKLEETLDEDRTIETVRSNAQWIIRLWDEQQRRTPFILAVPGIERDLADIEKRLREVERAVDRKEL